MVDFRKAEAYINGINLSLRRLQDALKMMVGIIAHQTGRHIPKTKNPKKENKARHSTSIVPMHCGRRQGPMLTGRLFGMWLWIFVDKTQILSSRTSKNGPVQCTLKFVKDESGACLFAEWILVSMQQNLPEEGPIKNIEKF